MSLNLASIGSDGYIRHFCLGAGAQHFVKRLEEICLEIVPAVGQHLGSVTSHCRAGNEDFGGNWRITQMKVNKK